MSMSVEQINALRKRIQSGEQVPKEELQAALMELRQGRTSAAPKEKEAKEPKKKSSKVKLTDDDIDALFAKE